MHDTPVFPIWALKLHDFDQLSSFKLSRAPWAVFADHVFYWTFAMLSIITMVAIDASLSVRLWSLDFIPAVVPILTFAYFTGLVVYMVASFKSRFLLTRQILNEYGSWGGLADAARLLQECEKFGEGVEGSHDERTQHFQAHLEKLRILRNAA